MITASHVIKDYGNTRAVDDISFEVKEGENLVLLGTSGCGKTTTLKMINRLIAMSGGSITVNGKDITQQSEETLRRSIGYVLQHNSLFPHYTVEENIAVVPALLKWDKARIKARTYDLLEKVHLSANDYLSVYPHELSGGQQQRVNIARALAADPPILLMDEPFGALDTITRAAIGKEFSEIDEFMRKTIVLVTHDVKEAFLLGDTICILNEGRIVQQGKPADLLFHPANDFVKEFLSASYLQLALNTVKVKDIWNEFTEQNILDNHSAVSEITENSSLWDLMEKGIKEPGMDIIIVKNKEGIYRQISKEDVFRSVAKFNYTS